MRDTELPDLFVHPRETMRERRVHLEEHVVYDVPEVPPLCSVLPHLAPRLVDIGGVRLYVEEQGRGRPLVLLHGGPGETHHIFHPAFTRLEDDTRVIYYDQRGCGQSDYHPGPGYGIAQSVADLHALRKALGIHRWTVLGASYGGFLAQCYAAAHPESVAGMVLVGAAVPAPLTLDPSRYEECLSPEELAVQNMLFTRTDFSPTQLMFNILVNGRWKRHRYLRPTRDTIARIARHEYKRDDGYEAAILKDWPAWDLRGAFDDGAIPTLIIEGKWDQTWSTDKPGKLHSLHPKARMECFEHSSHMPFNDEPSRFFAVLERFLAELPAFA